MSGVKREPRWLTEAEMAMLMRKSGVGRVLCLSFGPGGVLMRGNPVNEWAFAELDQVQLTKTRLQAMIADSNRAAISSAEGHTPSKSE